jgi:hypothetical protein
VGDGDGDAIGRTGRTSEHQQRKGDASAGMHEGNRSE